MLEGSGYTLEDVRAAGGRGAVDAVMMQYKKWEKGGAAQRTGCPASTRRVASSRSRRRSWPNTATRRCPSTPSRARVPIAQPQLAERYPLVFNSGARIFADFRSQHHGVAVLKERAPEPRVTLNADDAAARGIEQDDQVWVETPRGRARFRARVTGDIVAGAIDANMGGGGPLGSSAWQDCNVNDLTDLEHYDPISGFPVYKALLCEVVRDDGESRPAKRHALPERREVAEATAAVKQVVRREVYLDHNASTPVDEAVLDAMLPFLRGQGGNPSSVHGRGVSSRDAVEGARRKLAALIDSTARRIIFTGGGSEANNLAIKGAALMLRESGRHLVTSAVEHPAVLRACAALESFGFETTTLPVDSQGLIDPDSLVSALRPDTVLVSLMMANNELGSVQPIAECARICRERGVLIHTDAVQALGKIPLDVDELGVDLLSLSAHKVYGPKGVGALYVRTGVELSPLVHGGGQERGLRAGTENVAGIVGFGMACELAQRRLNTGELERVARLRDRLEEGVCQRIAGARVSGSSASRTPNTSSLVLPGMRGESLVLALDRHGVYFSSGSACKSGNSEPSHVLRAIGLSDEDAHCTIRLSLGVDTSEEELGYALEAFGRVVRESQSTLRFVGCR